MIILPARLKAFKLFFKLGSLCLSTPYEWDPIKSQLKISRLLWRRLGWLLSVLMLVVYFVNMAYTNLLMALGLLKDLKMASLTMNLICFVWYGMVAVCQVNSVVRIYAIRDCINNVLQFHAICTEKFSVPQNGKKIPDIFSTLMKMTLYNMYGQNILFLALYHNDPFNPRYLYHWLFSGGKNSWSYWTWHLFEYYIYCMSWYPVLLHMFTVVTFTQSTSHWLGQMTHGVNPKFTESIGKSLGRTYRILQILSRHMDECFGQIFWPTFVLSNIVLHACCIVVSIKLHGQLPPQIYYTFPFWVCAWVFMDLKLYNMLGNVNWRSTQFVKSWTDVVGSRGRKYLKTFFPLGINVAGLYTIQRSTALTLVLIISNATINVLLIHP